jgi:hypothetical protein
MCRFHGIKRKRKTWKGGVPGFHTLSVFGVYDKLFNLSLSKYGA